MNIFAASDGFQPSSTISRANRARARWRTRSRCCYWSPSDKLAAFTARTRFSRCWAFCDGASMLKIAGPPKIYAESYNRERVPPSCSRTICSAKRWAPVTQKSASSTNPFAN
jgi:hypothetical protein